MPSCKNQNVGTLKPKKFVNSIPLKQYGVTYKLNFACNRVRIQKLGDFRVLGLHQIPKGAEIANAVLVRKPSGYYLHVTCYLLKEHFKKEHIAEAVGIDFGVSNKIILSNSLAEVVQAGCFAKRLYKELDQAFWQTGSFLSDRWIEIEVEKQP